MEKKGFVLHSRKRHEGRGKKDHQFTFNDPVCLFVCSVSSLLGWFTGAVSPPPPPQVRSGERKKMRESNQVDEGAAGTGKTLTWLSRLSWGALKNNRL